jgi:flagellar biosynthesis protein FliP
MSGDFDFGALNDHLTLFLTMFVEMIYHVKEWFADAAKSLKENKYEYEAQNLLD